MPQKPQEKINLKKEYLKTFVFLLNKKYQDYAEKRNVKKRDYPKLTHVESMRFLFLSSLYNQKLFKIFDNWEALPKGPVENDIYKYLITILDFGYKYGLKPYNVNLPHKKKVWKSFITI